MRENRFIRQKFLVRKSGGRPPEVGVQAGSPPSREFTCTSIRNPAGFCNFSPAFSTAQAIIRGKTGRPEKHLFRRRQSHRPRDADLAGEMPVVGDDEQRSPIPCNGAGKDTEAGGEKARKGKTGRAQQDREAGTDETGKRKRRNRIPAGYFFGSTLCTRVKIRNLCGQNTAIGENATYHTEDGRALCGVPALLVGGGDRRGARTRPGGRRPGAKHTGLPECRERRGCRKRRARKAHRGRRERRGRHVPRCGAGYDRQGRRG